MALYSQTRTNLNDIERRAGASVFTIDGVAKEKERSEPSTMLEDGEIVFVGFLPPESLTTYMCLIANPGLPAGSTIDIGFAHYDSAGQFDGIDAFATGIVAEGEGRQTLINLPTDGVFDQDGNPSTVGQIMAGRGAVGIAAQVHLSMPLTEDMGINLRLVAQYTYFGTKSGAYIQ